MVDILSQETRIKSGVPQGSVIGSPIFLFYLYLILLIDLMVGMATRANNNHISGSGIGGLRENINSLGQCEIKDR